MINYKNNNRRNKFRSNNRNFRSNGSNISNHGLKIIFKEDILMEIIMQPID